MKEEQIIKAAKKLFSKFGYKKVSMDEIADEAGVTKRTVYSYFNSKEDLLKALIKEELKIMKNNIDEIENGDGEFFENTHKVIYSLLKYRKKSNLFKILFEEAEVVKNKQLKEIIKVIEEDIMNYIKTMLEKAKAQGKIKVDNIEIMSFLIYKMYIALMIEWNESYKKLDEKEIADNILQILEHGLNHK